MQRPQRCDRLAVVQRHLVSVLLGLGGLALVISSCSSSGVVSAPEASAPLHSSGGSVETSQAHGGSRRFDIAMVTVHNAARKDVRVLQVSPRTIGRLVFDGAALLSSADNNPGEGDTNAPFPVQPGQSLAPITPSRHPVVHAGANETLIVRVHVPPGKAGGATLSVSLRYRTNGIVYRTTYKMPYVLCTKAFDGGTCTQLQNRTLSAASQAA
jgi:hypothetical protein